MNWDALGAIAELLGAITVIATLIYLAIQIRQNTQSNQNIAIQTISTHNASWLSLIAQDESTASLYRKGLLGLDQLTDDEMVRFITLCIHFCRIYETQYELYNSGAIPEALWQGSLRTIQSMFKFLGVLESWETQKDLFSDTFQCLINEVISARGGS
jgi:uncharacterized membrane protein YjdF